MLGDKLISDLSFAKIPSAPLQIRKAADKMVTATFDYCEER